MYCIDQRALVMQEYNYVDQQVHRLSQIIAKVNRTYVTSREDDGHTNLYFDPLDHRVLGRWVAAGSKKMILTIDLQRLTLEWLDHMHQVQFSIPILGKSIGQLELAVESSLSDLGINPDGFRQPMHYSMPAYPQSDQVIHRLDPNALAKWERIRALANHACFDLLGYLQTPAEVRIWPHHFDTGVYVEPNKQMGLGFGLAMRDDMVGTPYFYLSVYALGNGPVHYDAATELVFGSWISEKNWQGAVLRLEEVNLRGPESVRSFQMEVLRRYLEG